MTTRARKALTLGSGILAGVAGFLCLNYTKAFDVDHHVAWAQRTEMPAPSYAMFLAGVGLLLAGGVLLGLARRT